MTRGRSPLTEKQERILVQCQLMGLTPKDMVQISNRLVALQREKEFIEDVAKVTNGLTYKVDKVKHIYEITDPGGNIFICKKSQKGTWYNELYDVKVLRTDGSIKTLKQQQVYSQNSYEVAKHCPEKNKRLYRLCKAVKDQRWI